MDKNKRRRKIEKVVSNNNLTTYDEIKKRLKEKYNISTSISTIKRDIDKLDIDKENNGPYMISQQRKKQKKIKKLKTNFNQNGKGSYEKVNLFSLKTKPGYAEVIAENLKNAFPNKVIGTIEKYDTILAIVNSEKVKQEILKELK